MRLSFFFALLFVLIPCQGASADGYAETEHRLKTAGIDEAMRLEIHAAIRKGVAWLRRVQLKNGSVVGLAGQTVLGGLALRHAGIPEGKKGAREALRWIMKSGRKAVRGRTYEAGLGSMLLESMAVEGAEKKFLFEIHARLRRGPRRAGGYWSYDSGGDSSTGNLSTAQFACLGLWAAERAGAKPALDAWRLHLDTLLSAQTEDGSWGYYPGQRISWGRIGSGYPTGTFMGLADVALAREALKGQIEVDAELDARVRIALARGRAALRRHSQWTLSAQDLMSPIGRFPYYSLYALEKACIFLDLEDVGGVHWYREGARWLLDQQRPKTGGWTGASLGGFAQRPKNGRWPASPQHTAFALLFLLRASAAYHPVTPRPVEGPQVTTPRAGDLREGARAEASSVAPPLGIMQGVVKRLETMSATPRLKALGPVLDALRLVRRFYRSSRTEAGFASPGHEVWARRVEDAVLALALRFRLAAGSDRVLWQALSLEALDALAALHPRVGPKLMKAISHVEHAVSFPPSYRFAWYGGAMESLRRLRPSGVVAWLGTLAISKDPDLKWRTSAALIALGGLAPSLSGGRRYRIARSLWKRLNSTAVAAPGTLVAPGLTRDMAVLMYRLASANDAGSRPDLGALLSGDIVRRMRVWWVQHDRPDDPLWR